MPPKYLSLTGQAESLASASSSLSATASSPAVGAFATGHCGPQQTVLEVVAALEGGAPGIRGAAGGLGRISSLLAEVLARGSKAWTSPMLCISAPPPTASPY